MNDAERMERGRLQYHRSGTLALFARDGTLTRFEPSGTLKFDAGGNFHHRESLVVFQRGTGERSRVYEVSGWRPLGTRSI